MQESRKKKEVGSSLPPSFSFPAFLLSFLIGFFWSLLQHDDRAVRSRGLRQRQEAADGIAARAGDQRRRQERDQGQVVLETLRTEEAVLAVHQRDGADHDDDQRRGREARQETDDQTQAAEKLADG